MNYRKLQIAWSVVWGLLAVLLVWLWLSSYWRMSGVWRISDGGVSTRLVSAKGFVRFLDGKLVSDGVSMDWGHRCC